MRRGRFRSSSRRGPRRKALAPLLHRTTVARHGLRGTTAGVTAAVGTPGGRVRRDRSWRRVRPAARALEGGWPIPLRRLTYLAASEARALEASAAAGRLRD